MGVAIFLGIYILVTTYVIRLLMRIPKNPRNKRIVLYLCLLTAILIPIKVHDPILLAFLIGVGVYISLVIFIIRLLMRIPKETRNKRIVFYLSIFTAILIHIWDIPLIDWKFNQLCKTEAGVHIYEAVALGPEYWKKVGARKSIPSRQWRLEDVIPDEFEIAHDWGGGYSSITSIKKNLWQIRRKRDQKIIGEVVYIMRGPSWLGRWIGIGGGGVCPDPGKVPGNRIAETFFTQKSN